MCSSSTRPRVLELWFGLSSSGLRVGLGFRVQGLGLRDVTSERLHACRQPPKMKSPLLKKGCSVQGCSGFRVYKVVGLRLQHVPASKVGLGRKPACKKGFGGGGFGTLARDTHA